MPVLQKYLHVSNNVSRIWIQKRTMAGMKQESQKGVDIHFVHFVRCGAYKEWEENGKCLGKSATELRIT